MTEYSSISLLEKVQRLFESVSVRLVFHNNKPPILATYVKTCSDFGMYDIFSDPELTLCSQPSKTGGSVKGMISKCKDEWRQQIQPSCCWSLLLSSVKVMWDKWRICGNPTRLNYCVSVCRWRFFRNNAIEFHQICGCLLSLTKCYKIDAIALYGWKWRSNISKYTQLYNFAKE